jgi:hypothetical protein
LLNWFSLDTHKVAFFEKSFVRKAAPSNTKSNYYSFMLICSCQRSDIHLLIC